MKYRDALKLSARALLTSWRLLPNPVCHFIRDSQEWVVLSVRLVLCVLLVPVLLVLPFFSWLLAPLVALMVQADHRKTLRQRAAWEAEIRARRLRQKRMDP